MSVRILILDDDNDLLEVISIVLSSKNYLVQCKNDCQHIEETVASIRPDVILMDNWIPDIGGVKATQKLKANPATSHIPVIFFSANHQVAELASEAGADCYLQKPFEIGDLEDVVAKALGMSPVL
jgi:CheY-like chemotaxis protein